MVMFSRVRYYNYFYVMMLLKSLTRKSFLKIFGLCLVFASARRSSITNRHEEGITELLTEKIYCIFLHQCQFCCLC